MVDNMIQYILCFGWLFPLLMGLLGLLLGWLFFGRNKVKGDLSLEGEGALRAETDSLRARVRELEGGVKTRDTEITGLKGKLAAGAAAAVAGGAAVAAAKSGGDDDDASYALEWRNRYLAARVKYLEGRVAEAPKAKAAPKKKKAVAKKAAPKKVAVKKAPAKKKAAPKAKAAPKPKVLYTDGPTDGAPDDLKLIKGIGPKFEKDLNSKGIYYFRQIAAWKAKDVTMVEGVIDSFPGRIGRDEWIKQAGGLAKGKGSAKKAPAKKAAAKKKPAAKKAAPKKTVSKAPEKGTTEWYLSDARRFHKTADKAVLSGIAKYCGIAMRSRDTSLVACSDQKERDTIIKGFAAKKLGQDAKAAAANVDAVCKEMKDTRFKNRVTFYYLMAKNARKLSAFK